MHHKKETISLLYEANLRFNSAGSVGELLDLLLEMLERSLSADLVSIWFLQQPELVLSCVLAEGEGKERFENKSIEVGKGLLGDLIQRQAPLWLHEQDDAERLLDKFGREWGLKISFLAIVPLSTGDKFQGASVIVHRTAYPEDRHTRNLDFVQQLVEPWSLALSNLNSRESLAKRIHDLTTLSEIGTELSSSLEIEQVLKTLILNIMGHFAVEHVAILLSDEKEGNLVIAESHSLAENVRDLDFSLEGNLATILTEGRAPLFVGSLPEESLTLDEQERVEKLYAYLLVPIFVKDELLGLITLGEKLTRESYDENEVEFLSTIASQTGIAVKNARLFHAERKAREFSLLLEISKEITATLDLDRILNAFVNYSAQVIEYDRATVALLRGEDLRIASVSGQENVDRKNEEILLLENLLSWVAACKNSIYVTSLEGEIQADNEEAKEKTKAYFEKSHMHSLLAIPLIDEEGILGVASMESQSPSFLSENGLEVVEILSNQLTVAIRNAQLYQQIPLVRVIQPIVEKKKALFAIPRRKLITIGAIAVMVLAFLILWKNEIEITCPVEVWPKLTCTATAESEGIIEEVLIKEGDIVLPGQLLATLDNQELKSRLDEVHSMLKASEGNARLFFSSGRIPNYQIEKNQTKKLEAELSWLQSQLGKTSILSPTHGTVLTSRIEESVGRYLNRGDPFCQVADLNQMRVEVHFPDKDIAMAKKNQKIKLLMDAFPQKTFWGTVEKVSPSVDSEEEDNSFLVLGNIENGQSLLKPGMTGHAKVSCGKRSLAYLLFRKPARLFRDIAWKVWGI